MRNTHTIVPFKFAILAVIALTFSSGCAKNLIKGSDSDRDANQPDIASYALTQYELIAIDLVNAMVQIDELHPSDLSGVKLAAPKNSFGSALFTVLKSAGYNVRQPGSAEVYTDLKWSVTPAVTQNVTAEDTQPELFSIMLRNLTLSRNYQLGSRSVKPTSNLKISGVANIPIKLHDELFDQVALPSKKSQAAQTRRDSANAALGNNVRNIIEIGGSNYQDQISRYNDVGSLVVNFSNESAKLSESSGIQLRRFYNFVNRGSDAVWVVGCSIGSTQYKGGNESLARSRTKAVADWLKNAGMNAEQLFTESCWAEQPGQLNMPGRGVQLTLLRERKN